MDEACQSNQSNIVEKRFKAEVVRRRCCSKQAKENHHTSCTRVVVVVVHRQTASKRFIRISDRTSFRGNMRLPGLRNLKVN